MTVDNSMPVRYRLVPVSDPWGPYAGCKGLWADPDLDHAAGNMRQLVSNTSLGAKLGEAARKTIREQYSAAAVGTVHQTETEIHLPAFVAAVSR